MDHEKLALLEGQRNEIEKFILADPTNEQYLKMKEDLNKLISMTRQIAAISGSGPVEDAVAEETDQNGQSNVNDSDDDGVSDIDSDNDDDAHLSEAAIRAHNNAPFAVGTIVEVVGSDRPYPGVITAVLDAENFRVKYYEFDAEVTLPLTNLVRIRSSLVKPSEVQVGFKGQCIYPVDQLFYDATVTALTDHGCVVLYTQYGNSCEVPLNYLKPLQQKSKKASDGTTVVKIPEHLKILPTDTEEERLRKKKRIKAIKSKNRIVTKEAEASAVQSNWKKFVNKATKRNVEGLNKASMFASPEAIEGRVGVTNSGKGLTDFATRKKNKF